MNLDDIRKTIQDISNSPKRQYIFTTGERGMFIFDLMMRGIKLPSEVNYCFTTFKKLPDILQINIRKKHGMLKIIVNMKERIYIPCVGTKKFGVFTDINRAVKKLI